jgi:hypothetical protein
VVASGLAEVLASRLGVVLRVSSSPAAAALAVVFPSAASGSVAKGFVPTDFVLEDSLLEGTVLGDSAMENVVLAAVVSESG